MWLWHNDSMLCCGTNRGRLSLFATLALNGFTFSEFTCKNVRDRPSLNSSTTGAFQSFPCGDLTNKCICIL